MDLNPASDDSFFLMPKGYGATLVAKVYSTSAASFGRTASVIQSSEVHLSMRDSSWDMKKSQPLIPSASSGLLDRLLSYRGQKKGDSYGVGLQFGSRLSDKDFEKILSEIGTDKPSSCVTEAIAKGFSKTQCPLWQNSPASSVDCLNCQAKKHNGIAAFASNGTDCNSRYLFDDKEIDSQSAETTDTYQAEDFNTERLYPLEFENVDSYGEPGLASSSGRALQKRRLLTGRSLGCLQQADEWSRSHQSIRPGSPSSSTNVERLSDSISSFISARSAFQSLSGNNAELALKSDWQNKFDFFSGPAYVSQERDWERSFETLGCQDKSRLAMGWKSKINELRYCDNSSEELTPLIDILNAIKNPDNYLWLIKQTDFMSVSFAYLSNKKHMDVLVRLDSIVQHDQGHLGPVLDILFKPFEKNGGSYVAMYLDRCIYDHVDNIINDGIIQLGKNIIMILTHVVELGLCSTALDKMLKIWVISHRTGRLKKTVFLFIYCRL